MTPAHCEQSFDPRATRPARSRIYFFVTSRWQSLRTRRRLGGLSAGFVIFLVMNFVVMPLSAAPVTYREILEHFRPLKSLANLLAMLVFGLTVAYCAYRLAGERAESARGGSLTAEPDPVSTCLQS